ncbi:unnamed protein product, partial [Rhizoctonia solani]
MPLSRFPTEVILHVTSYLPHPSIISASLVCKAWRLVLLRTLYHSVKFVDDSHAVHFANTITLGGVAGLSHHISGLIKSLSIGSKSSIYTVGLELTHMEPCIIHFVLLRQFHCHIYLPAGENLEFLKLVQTQCPQLESVNLHIWGVDTVSEIESSQLTTLFGFRNLVKYSLCMRYIVWNIDRETLGPLKTLVFNCPYLESLKLDPSFEDFGLVTTYNLNVLPDLFGQDLTMPHLHTLHLCGNIEIHIASLLGPPAVGSYQFRDFLSRHPQIKDFKLGWSNFTGSWENDLHPNNLGHALPSLKCCSAPLFLCAQLACSAVGAQLEQLTVQDSVIMPVLPSEALPMPTLKVLHIK